MTPAGYSGTPLAKKLGCKPDGRLLTHNAPQDWEVPDAVIAELAPGAEAGSATDVVVSFFSSRAELSASIEDLARAIFPDGSLWIAWPRRAAGHDSDVREQDIRDLALPLGLVDVKVAALGEDWSGLRLFWRRERRG
jgi:hypothetical protein